MKLNYIKNDTIEKIIIFSGQKEHYPDAAKGVKILLTDIGASFERRCCSIEVKWASVEDKC